MRWLKESSLIEAMQRSMDQPVVKPVDLGLLAEALSRWAEATMQAREMENVSVA